MSPDEIAASARLAYRTHQPLIIEIAESPGLGLEGIDSLAKWGAAAAAVSKCSGRVPIVACVSSPMLASASLLLGLADHVVMTDHARAFVSGPANIREFTGQSISGADLGGLSAHSQLTGLCSLSASDAQDAALLTDLLLAYVPASCDDAPPRWANTDPHDRACDSAASVIPARATGSYDVRDLISLFVDEAEFLEVRERWAPNIVTGLATFDGYPAGVVANQPCQMAGTLDIAASQKGARFVAWCDSMNLPIITLVDTPGFFPGKDVEWRGMIRHGAQMAFAYAQATVPRICVVLRKSYGGAYIVMDSKTMGNDLCMAWPTAEIAVMGAKGAAEILQRRATPEDRAAAEADYEERLLNPYQAAERGYVDAVIDPTDTRRRICSALDLLSSKREHLVRRSHANTPL